MSTSFLVPLSLSFYYSFHYTFHLTPLNVVFVTIRITRFQSSQKIIVTSTQSALPFSLIMNSSPTFSLPNAVLRDGAPAGAFCPPKVTSRKKIQCVFGVVNQFCNLLLIFTNVEALRLPLS